MKQRGFTLLEAIVSLVLIASTGMALFSWINTNLISLHRIQQTQEHRDAVRNALAFVKTLNPLESPKGEETVGIYTFQWHSEAIEPPKDVIGSSGAVGLFQIGLYAVEVEISQENEILTKVTVRQVGYKQVREPPEF
jgi:general secretion pathway protein I